MYKELIKKGLAHNLNKKDVSEGPIVYWMRREIRSSDNWSLIFAQGLAESIRKPVVVIYNLTNNFSKKQNRHLTFEVFGLKEVEKKLNKNNIFFKVFSGYSKTDDIAKNILKFCNDISAGSLVTDFFPLNDQKNIDQKISKKLSCTYWEIDSHNIVPARIASNKKEFAAYTIRPKINKKLADFLIDYPRSKKQKINFSVKNINNKKFFANNWTEILPKSSEEHFDWIIAGEDEARKSLKFFLKNKLSKYNQDRNNPNIDALSNFSPYLHYGMISSQRIALETINFTKSNGINYDKSSTESFLEELIIRKELSDNYCLYEKNYDNFDGFPDWAKKTLNITRNDKREYVYSLKDFEYGRTHDLLWNAAQIQMVRTGKMHGYMRMYWAKKILEWTKNPEDAQKIAIYLNNKYELDGNDPNGYVGIAWSIGGVHDRAWFSRPIFGKIRYMSISGCKKKFDVDEYIKNNLDEIV
ncbi:MAG TPA: deoxyribodipyrimidine photo-lyase [Candidatus Paceibacterota bacterium]|nr:deoxyribodipyrimidine photo-lyase [Candidatus Paceibacterota bacterium]